MTRDEAATKIGLLLAPLREREEHVNTGVYWRITMGERCYITVLVTAPDPNQLIVAADFLHSTIADAFPGASVAILSGLDRLAGLGHSDIDGIPSGKTSTSIRRAFGTGEFKK